MTGCEDGGVVLLREKWLTVGSMPQSRFKALVLCSVARVMDPASFLEDADSHRNADADADANADADADTDTEDGMVTTRQQYYVPSSKLSLQLFRCFGDANSNGSTTSPERLLLNLSKSPFVEVRLGAYELMRAFVSNVKTGATILLSQAGFLEFLLSY